MTGTWNGDWGTGHDSPHTLAPTPIQIEADAKDKSGKAEHIVADGHLDNHAWEIRLDPGTFWNQLPAAQTKAISGIGDGVRILQADQSGARVPLACSGLM